MKSTPLSAKLVMSFNDVSKSGSPPVINVTNFPRGTYYTGRGRSRNHGEQASAAI